VVIARLILASLWRQRGLYVLWALSLAAAVSGLTIIDVYRSSLGETLRIQGAKILSAHISMSARRLLTAEEREKFAAALPPGHRRSEMTEMFAMVATTSRSRLASLRFTDDVYPLVGEITVDGRVVKTSELGREPGVWIAPDFIPLLGVSTGDRLKIGSKQFKILGVVRKDSSQTFRVGGMAPKIYVHKKFLKDTGLVQFGTTLNESVFAQVPEPVPLDLKKPVEKALSDPAVQITVPADLEQGSLRVLSRLLDYLGLVGLVTLALGWIGVFYLGRRWLMLEQASGGLLKCLGFTATQLRRMWMIKLSIILFTGIAAGGLAAWLGSNAAVPLFRAGLPDDFSLVWSWRNTVVLMLIGPGMGWLLLAESISRTAAVPALALVTGQAAGARSVRLWLALLASLALFAVALTFLQARSWTVTYTFIGALLGSIALAAGLGALSLAAVKRYRHGRQGWLWHTASALWLRRPGLAVLLMTVSALCGLLSQLIPHLEKTIVGELHSVPADERPGLFMFDVQDEQIQPIRDLMQKHGIEISQQSPFIRARLLQVNGVDFERSEVNAYSTREEEGNARLRNRGVNLSFRDKLGPAEKVIAGKPFEELSTEPTELSVEEGYAERLGLNMNDKLLFDVQGVEVTATVANLRRVNWDSFEPNFFMQLRPGVIDGAPKTWIVTLKRHATVKPADIQQLLSGDFPNVTSVNVEEAVDAISALLTKLGGGLRLASRLSLALGLFVFIMILMFQLLSSEKDWIQLHRQGLRGNALLKLQLTAYATLSVWGAILGSALSLFVCWALARWAFSTRPQFDWTSLWQILALTSLLSVAGLILLSRRQMRITRFKSRFDTL